MHQPWLNINAGGAGWRRSGPFGAIPTAIGVDGATAVVDIIQVERELLPVSSTGSVMLTGSLSCNHGPEGEDARKEGQLIRSWTLPPAVPPRGRLEGEQW